MRNYLKLLLLAVLCLSLLAGCGKKTEEPADNTAGTTTVPQETTEGTAPEETTTEKPVNIVEDPLNNGEGDPTDAMDSTNPSEEDKPGVDIEIDDGNTGNAGNGNTGTTVDVYGPLKTETDYNIRLAGKDLFFTGAAGNDMFNTGTLTAAVKLQIEKVEGKGIKIFFMKGNAKTYLEIKAGGVCALSTTGSVFAYNGNTYVVTVGGTGYYLAANTAGTSIAAATVGSGTTAVEFVSATTGTVENGDGDDDFVIDFDDLT